jgi:hypothetical protein
MIPIIAIIGILTGLLAMLILSIKAELDFYKDRNRQLDEIIASLPPPAPEDPAHKAQYQHLRRAQP